MMNKEQFTKTQLITYLGNKRSLIDQIEKIIIDIKNKLKQDTLKCFDGFSGSGCVARMLKYHASDLYVNDLENYSFIINNAYLSNPNESEIKLINEWISKLNEMEYNTKGVISNNYAPIDDTNIKKYERTFYTTKNANIIDSIRKEIENAPEEIQKYLFAQLLVKASIHTNTCGVFKGFYKNNLGIGQFGGQGKNALERITSDIKLDNPIFSDQLHKVNVTIFKKDINELIKDSELPQMDITYYDPPYNQHPYGSNYHILNTIIDNNIDENKLSKVAGIPNDWNKSEYNYKEKAKKAFIDLLENTRSKYIIISYNNEGILKEEWMDVLKPYKYEKVEIDYNTFRGSRNLNKRDIKVKEILWVIEKNNDENKQNIHDCNNVSIDDYCEKCLKKLKVKQLHQIVINKTLFRGYTLLKKNELINKIIETEEN